MGMNNFWNPEKGFGDNMMLNDIVLFSIYQELKGDYYVITSSVHEVIILKEEFGSPEALRSMIEEVNATQVDIDEQLSNTPYLYKSKDRQLILA